MTTYSKGKIYKLVSNVSDLIYIGSTCNPLPKRFYQHKSQYKRWLEGKHNYVTSFKLFVEDEIENTRIILIEKFPCDSKMELAKRERYFVEQIDCVNKQIPGRSKKEYDDFYRETNREMINQKNREYYERIKDTIKKEYYETNKDKILKQHKDYYEVNKDKITERNKKYREDNKDNIKTIKKAYYQNNKKDINERRKEKGSCDICNKEMRKESITRHKKTVHKK